MSRSNKITSAAVIAVVAVGLAGCSSSSKPRGTSGSKSTLKVMVIAPATGAFTITNTTYGAQVAANEINSAGGVDGRHIEIVSCDDTNNPNGATACARKAVADKVVALVGGFTAYEANVLPAIEAAGIPWIAPTPISNFTSKSYFIVGGDPASSYFGFAKSLVAKGCKRIGGIGEDFAAAHQAEQLLQLGVLAAGGKYIAASYAPQGAADFAPAVSSEISKGADCLGLISTAQGAAKIIGAAAGLNKNVPIGSISQIVPGAIIKSLGATGNRVLSTSAFLPFSSTEAGVVALRSAVDKLAPGSAVDDFTDNGYVGVKIVAKAAAGLASVTATTLAAALPTITGFDTGLGATISLGTANPSKAFSRVFNTSIYSLVAKDGAYVLAAPKPFDTLPAFQAAAAAGK